jgi:RNA ligase (TIGR02306 family)
MTRSILHEGHDVTDVVKITKYEKPMPEGSEGIGGLPSFLRKTDEPNILSAPHLLDALQGKFVYFSKKMDGQSATFYLNNDRFGVCSRKMELRETSGSPFWQIAREKNLEQIMRAEGGNFVLQGELYGPGIQGNHMGSQIKELALFNLFDSDAHKYRDIGVLSDMCKRSRLPLVEVLWAGRFEHTIPQLQEIANNLTYDNGAPAEGVVIRPVREMLLESGERLSVKIISEKFLAKNKE